MNDIGLRETAACTIQRWFRNLPQNRLIAFAQRYIDDPAARAQLPQASSGIHRYQIYMPNELPVVIRPVAQKRFEKTSQARRFCVKQKYRYLVVPWIRCQGNFTIEQRMPTENATAHKGILFYCAHRQCYDAAIEEFVSFLCHASLQDLVHNRIFISTISDAKTPRFDNLLLYLKEQQGKIAFVDLESFTLGDQFVDQAYHALSTAVQLFPYHAEQILAGEKYALLTEQQRDRCQTLAKASRVLYDALYEVPMAFFRQAGITVDNYRATVTLTEERKEVLKRAVTPFVKTRLTCGVVHFHTKMWPELIELVEEALQTTFTHISASWEPPKSAMELVFRRSLEIDISSILQDYVTESSVLVDQFGLGPLRGVCGNILEHMVGHELVCYKLLPHKQEVFLIF